MVQAVGNEMGSGRRALALPKTRVTLWNVTDPEGKEEAGLDRDGHRGERG